MIKIVDLVVNRYVDRQESDMGHARGQEVIVVTVHTDQGITGTGYFSTPVFDHGMVGDVCVTLLRRNIRQLILGQNPLHTEQVWQCMMDGPWRTARGGLVLSCISAVDFALWDIKGKIFNVPVSDLFGHRRELIPTYANVGHQLSPDQLAQKAAEYVSQGHRAVKIRGGTAAVPLAEATKRVAAVREAIGPEVKLMVDINGSWDAETAIQQLRAWEKHQLYWLEEPVSPEDLTGYIKVKEYAGQTFIAGGEQNSGLNEFRLLIEHKAVDIVQPNANATGGITDWLRIYRLASLHHVPVSPWNLQQIHIHMAAGLPNVKWIEYFTPDRNYFPNQLFSGPVFKEVRKEDGVYFQPPEEPGLGLKLNEELADQTLVSE
jgi:L-alanine-DL-glutamate epimerase-like enolase superfamily enzyme